MATGLYDPTASAQRWLTQGFHSRHLANDIALVNNSILRAPESGRVFAASWNADGWGIGGGYCIIIDHNARLRSLMAHNARLIVRKGQRVVRGQIVGYTDTTGNSTGPHLHFAVRRDGVWIDPRRCFAIGRYPSANGQLRNDLAMWASQWLNAGASNPLYVRAAPNSKGKVKATLKKRTLVGFDRIVIGQDPYGDRRPQWARIWWGTTYGYVWAPRTTRI